ncbi:hypothetical protein ACIQYW_18440 [Rhodococcus erythropolis]
MKKWFTTTGLHCVKKYGPWLCGFALAFVAGLLGSAVTIYGLGTAKFWDVAAQPIATATAGVLAIGAATIAFLGVRYAQKVAISTAKANLRQQGTAQIRQSNSQQELIGLQLAGQHLQANQHRDQIALQNNAQLNQTQQHYAQLEALADLERSKHRRQVTFDALVAANNALVELNESFVLVSKAIDMDLGVPDSDFSAENAARAQCEIRLTACTNAASLLLMLGFEDSYKAIMDTNLVVREQLAFGRNEEITFVTMDKFARTFMTAVGSLVGKYDSDVGKST